MAGPPPIEPPRGGAGHPIAATLHFAGIVEVERFSSFTRHAGYLLGRRAMAALQHRITTDLHATEIAPAGRGTLEFAFSAWSEAEARARLMALGRAFDEVEEITALGYELRLSIGIARVPAPVLDQRAIDCAEQALAEAQRGRRRIVFLDSGAPPRDNSLALLAELQTAIRNGDLEPFYMPKLRARSHEIVSAEALVRWRHPERGLILPEAFIPVAEESGQIRRLTELVIDRALADQETLRASGFSIGVDVNLSGALLADLDFTAWAVARLAGHPGAIGFEITETAMIHDPDGALANLRCFADAGIRLSIDDYGAGFSSLAYLQKLPVQELKIDKSFISGLANTQRDPLLVRSTIELAHALDMQVVAEGVDTPEVLALLQVMGCDSLQGYLISEPLPLAGFTEFLQAERYREIASFRPSLGRASRRNASPLGAITKR